MKFIGGVLTIIGLGYVLTGLAQLLMAAAWTPERIIIFGIGVIVVAGRIYRSNSEEKTSG